ncbi:hypothetical protein LZ012_16795 [Dechloromonas sp. XY25]|uniref:PEP-CTERM sorting domain-containing protein n=1 Tax=Dechloromonas hankyongensis TaxID=2908002 RepID=A0ABS9K661_9RHOO|nr:hypothetical protein [Dechloromonas hankyongensis]MCG2578658.1 hypothetical protein [Dechloromonas hankyongensis]
MQILKLLAIAILTIHLAGAAEPAGSGSPPVPRLVNGGAESPAGQERHPGSVLDPPADGDGYRFSLAIEPQPENWSLLLGGLLSIGFIVGRRLAN